ncbi:DUF2161 domain-containing phosphodiesterase [Falsibacillus pallidus]|uniref:Uncharacterized protein n=1 Tax=Falsibacillus pallidus TaxID=493781 RepID=A0A370GQG4_9BACI|nr:DUF2161 family putative PD-(D/E)XK-type phosphodiesterase [Falsibacillus pallidus]RDI45486.1 hypothetical protein DFR59_102114 [Falsibacillus pallidus]
MKKQQEKRLEADLYEPIRKYFVKQGYDVYGEVKHCDIAAIKEDELLVVELKLNMTVDLLIQAAKRQKAADQVYIGIPKPKYSLFSKKWKDLCHLIRRMELGLIIVSFQGSTPKAEVRIEPQPFDRKKSRQQNRRRRKQIIQEIQGRNGDYNVGGSTKTKIVTAYKENCIQIAHFLKENGPMSPKGLRDLGTGDKTTSILSKNYEGWFERVQRGVYTLTEKGQQELVLYEKVVQYYADSNNNGSE